MKSSLILREALSEYKSNELIFASRLYLQIRNSLNEAAYYKMLERLCKTGELAKAAKGMYYIPSVSKYGIVPISEKDIIRTFTGNNKGVVIGYRLYNSLKLTTQVGKTVSILSSVLDGFSKTVKNVNIKQVDIEFTAEVKKMICGLEVLQNFYEIQDLNYLAFIDFSERIALSYKEEAFEKVISKISYKKSTISFLKEILNYYKIPNNLENHLSSLSNYKHPLMEELYEFTQK